MKRHVNRILTALTGYGLSRIRSREETWISKLRDPWLQSFSFKTILDVGANLGQFAKVARVAFPEAKIVCFEAIPEVAAALKDEFHNDPMCEVHSAALGSTSGSIDFHVGEVSAVSSALAFDSNFSRSFGDNFAKERKTISVPVQSLDSFFIEPVTGATLLKIDVQGFELEVLQGAQDILLNTDAIIIETSFVELYKGQPLFDEIYNFLRGKEFEFRFILDELRSKCTFEPVQIDAIFTRRRNNE